MVIGHCVSGQLNHKYEQLRLQVVDFHVTVLTTCLQHADYFAGLAGDLTLPPMSVSV